MEDQILMLNFLSIAYFFEKIDMVLSYSCFFVDEPWAEFLKILGKVIACTLQVN